MLEKAPMSGDTYADELLEHLLTDYHASDGHALAMHWLFQLFVKEAVRDGDLIWIEPREVRASLGDACREAQRLWSARSTFAIAEHNTSLPPVKANTGLVNISIWCDCNWQHCVISSISFLRLCANRPSGRHCCEILLGLHATNSYDEKANELRSCRLLKRGM